MKISAKKYAQALYESVENVKNAHDLKQSINNFVLILNKNNDLRKINDIFLQFAFIYNKKNNVNDGQLITASKLDDKTMKEIKTCIRDFLRAEDVNLSHQIDSGILGGFRAIFANYVIDASVRSRLNKLKHSLLS